MTKPAKPPTVCNTLPYNAYNTTPLKRPRSRGTCITTPKADSLLRLIGGFSHETVTLTSDEKRALDQLYDFTEEEGPAKELFQAGADRNMFRHARMDGFRIIAWLAKYLPEGEDPLKTVVQLAMDAGWDVDPEDASWASDEGDNEASPRSVAQDVIDSVEDEPEDLLDEAEA